MTFITNDISMNLWLFLFHLRFRFINLALIDNFLFDFADNLRHYFAQFFTNWIINTLGLENFIFFFGFFFWDFYFSLNKLNLFWFFDFFSRLIVNNNLLSIIIEVFIVRFLYLNFNFVHSRFEKNLHIWILI